jgi:excisionase family DNA binding protein
MDDETQGLTVEEAAKIAKCSLPNIYKAIYGERITAHVVTKGAKAEWRINEESLREWRRTLKRGRPPTKEWPGGLEAAGART